MATSPGYAGLLADLFCACMLALSLGMLLPQRAQIARGAALRRLQMVLMAFMGAVLLTMGILSLLIFVLARVEILTRFAHAVYLLGLWMVAALLAGVLITGARAQHLVWLPSLAGLTAAGISLAIFTPITRFAAIFGPLGLGPPLVTGGVVIVVCTVSAWVLQSTLVKA